MSASLLSLGFVLGMRHALESDHLAAVATLASRSPSVADSIRQGAVWGAGHTLALLLFGSLVLVLDAVIPESLAQLLEFLVGLMLILLGVDVLRRLRAGPLLAIAGHAPAPAREVAARAGRPFPIRALLVGIMHGMAGSAALILLALQSVQSPATGLLYIALFGVGSIAGMATLSLLIAMPLRYSRAGPDWAFRSLQGLVGLTTLAVGGAMVYEIGILGGLAV